MTDFRSRIRKAEDVIKTENIIVTIFGEPNMGKTSISFTSESPLHLDYDKGVQRSVGRKDSLDIFSWQDGIDLLQSNYIEENNIKTVVIDTVGTALDNFCSRHVIEENPKNGKAGGGLAIGGYGALKDKWTFFTMLAKAKKVDIILLCHSSEEKEDDRIKKIPKITGGSYDIVKQASDLIGFMESRGNKRTLDFNTTDRHDGKNCPEFPLFELPHFTDPKWPKFLAKIIQDTKDHMNKMSNEQKEALKLLNDTRENILNCVSLDELTKISEVIESIPTALKLQLKSALADRFVSLWSEEYITPLSVISELDQMIKTIEQLDKQYVIPMKRKLLDHAKSKGFTIEKGDSGFKKIEEPKTQEATEENLEETVKKTK